MVKGSRALDITGDVYGQLTAISNTGQKNKNGSYVWNFQCSCGNTLQREIGNIRFRRDSASCEVCEKAKISSCKTLHGGSIGKNKVYKAWCKIKERCFNENDPNYSTYGGAGITLYDGWVKDFAAFKEYIGDPPKDGKHYSVDRVDNNLGYFPDNIRWATDSQQARNKSRQRNNTSGVVGVAWRDKVWPCGQKSTRYAVTQWHDLQGRIFSKSFSVKKHGEELAFFMACEYREQQINLLNLMGAGYTQGHGKPKQINLENV
jgi:hypothetical protein